jgi:Holliday junction resolvase
MRESKVEEKICDHARKTGWQVYKFVSPGRRGVPDRMFICPGKVVFMEIKAPGKKPTPLQMSELEKLWNRGVHATWVDSAYEGKIFLDFHLYKP